MHACIFHYPNAQLVHADIRFVVHFFGTYAPTVYRRALNYATYAQAHAHRHTTRTPPISYWLWFANQTKIWDEALSSCFALDVRT